MTGVIRDKNQIVINNTPHFAGSESDRFKITIDGQDRLIIDTNATRGADEDGNPQSTTGRITFVGDFHVQGQLTTLETRNLVTEDNIVLFNRGETGAGVSLAASGLEIDRGTQDNTSWLFDEVNDWWGPYGANATANGPTKTIGNIERIDVTTGDQRLVVNGTGSVRLAKGDVSQRPSDAQAGEMRYNTEYTMFEGFSNGVWAGLGGVIDLDRDTFIIAETGPGDDNDTLDFHTSGSMRMQIDDEWVTLQSGQKLSIPGLTLGEGQGNVGTAADIHINASGLIATDQNMYLFVDADGNGSGILDVRYGGNTVTSAPSSNRMLVATQNGGTLFGAWYVTSNLNVTGTTNLNGLLDMHSNNIQNAGHTTPDADNARDLGGSALRWRDIYGVSTTALYADLAERYMSDKPYDPGTVVVFGGENEITASTRLMDTRVAGVISTDPAYKMNDKEGYTDETHPYVALKGRVPCKVTGHIRKGDMLVTSDIVGCATAYQHGEPKYGSVIGKALENFDGEFGIIEVAV